MGGTEGGGAGAGLPVVDISRLASATLPGHPLFLITQYEAKVMGENPSVAVMARGGSAPNQAEELTDGYTIRDLKLHCADGSPATFLDRVRVQGSVEARGLGRWIWVDRIEKL